GAWTPNPTAWDNGFFDTLLGWEWKLTKSPAGANQWTPTDPAAATLVPDAHDPTKRHAPMMSTADIALRTDPAYLEISKRFRANPEQFTDAFARVVQAHAPRHGPEHALRRSARAEGRARLAGSHSGCEPSADRRAGYRVAQGHDSRVG